MSIFERPVRVAIVGSGPAGFYAAGHLLAHESRVRGGHARAPADAVGARALGRRARPPEDQVGHARVREDGRSTRAFATSATSTFGEHVSREELLEHYHAIVYAIGSPSRPPARASPAKTCPARTPATEFVGWYNGHPDHADLEVDLFGRARRRDRQRQRRGGRRADARARARRARADRHRRPRAGGARARPRRARSSCSAAAGPRRPRSPTPSCSSWAS